MSEPFMGTVMIWAPNFAPRGWAFCQGQIMSISTNSALFSLLGRTYGGNGQTTFGLPNLAGRVPVGQGQSPGTSDYTLGETAGTENVTLTTAQMPAHIHNATLTLKAGVSFSASANQAQSHVPSSEYNTLAAPYDPNSLSNVSGFIKEGDAGALVPLAGAQMENLSGSVNVAPTGSNLPFNVLQPYQVLNYVIALEGIFPSRN